MNRDIYKFKVQSLLHRDVFENILRHYTFLLHFYFADFYSAVPKKKRTVAMSLITQAVQSFHQKVHDHNSNIRNREALERKMCDDKTDLFNALTVLTIAKVAFAVFRGTSFFGLILTGLALGAREIVNKSFKMGLPDSDRIGFEASGVLPKIVHQWGSYPIFLKTDTCKSGKWVEMTELNSAKD